MRIALQPKPSLEELRSSPLHVIARDYPETLSEFERHGVSLRELGDRELRELEDAAGLLEDLERSTRWRPLATRGR